MLKKLIFTSFNTLLLQEGSVHVTGVNLCRSPEVITTVNYGVEHWILHAGYDNSTPTTLRTGCKVRCVFLPNKFSSLR